MDEKDADRFEALKKRLLGVGMPIPGTIHALYAQCGSPTCPCATDKKKRHGPYYRWHYRVKGRCVAQGINTSDLQKYEKWIENREKMYHIIDEILALGTNVAAAEPDGQEKSDKSESPMRGK